jgi:hypothetical protein
VNNNTSQLFAAIFHWGFSLLSILWRDKIGELFAALMESNSWTARESSNIILSKIELEILDIRREKGFLFVTIS